MFWDLKIRRSWGGYIFAVLIVAFVALVRLTLLQNLGNNFPFSLFYPTVMLVGAFGGLLPGLVASVLAICVISNFWLEPVGFLTIGSPIDKIGMIIFLSSCCIISIICEIMHRNQMSLHDSREELKEKSQLLNFAHDYIMVRDIDSRITYWNQGAVDGYGFTASEAIGKVTYNLLKTQFPISVEYVMDKLLTEGHWQGELSHTRKDGKQILVTSYQTLNRDAIGNPVMILEINHDVTSQKKYEADLLRLDKLNIIGEMAASIGHEVRNPMTTVRGYLQYFSRKFDFSEHSETFALMIEELDRANFIITDFLSLAKDKAINLILTDLNKVIHNISPLLLTNALRRGSNIEFELRDILEVFADENEMRQCILNLVSNGLDAMPDGGKLTISTAIVGHQVIMTVRDKGLGISHEIKDKIGIPFFTTKENGTGLGLSICYQIAQRHKAIIEIETGPEGTAFQFIFNPMKLADK